MISHIIGRVNKNTIAVASYNSDTGKKIYTTYSYLCGDFHILNVFYKKLYKVCISGHEKDNITILSSTIHYQDINDMITHYNNNNIFPSIVPVFLNNSWFSKMKFKIGYLLRRK